MLTFGRSLIFVLLSAVIFSAAAAGAETVKWWTLSEGMPKAKADKKPVLVDFYFGKGCPRCERLDRDVYGDPAIAKKLNSDFIPIRIDLTGKLTEEEQKLGDKFDFKMDCMLLFLDPDGKVMTDYSGKRLCFVENVEPDWFVSYLDIVKNTIKKQ